MPSVEIHATVQVCCIHHQEKRSVTEMEFDPARHKIHLCPCCENLHLKVSDEPGPCRPCGGTG